jgi:hypothetical protein
LNAVEIDNIQRRFGLSAGINLSLPIFDGGQKDITRQQSTIAENITSDFKNYAAKNIYIRRKDAENKIYSLRKNIADYINQIPLNLAILRFHLKLLQIKYRNQILFLQQDF